MTEQAGMGEPSIVAEVATYAKRMPVDTMHIVELHKETFHIRNAHVIVWAMREAHRRVHAYEVIPLRGEQFPGLIAQTDARIMGIEQAFTVLFANIEEAFLQFVVVGGHGRDLPAATTHALAAAAL